MWIENEVIRRDLDALLEQPIDFSAFDGKQVLITGATGLIGSNLVNALLYYGLGRENPPTVLALIRSEDKARRMLGAQLEQCPHLKLVQGDVTTLSLPDTEVDFIIHAASQTASRAMVEQPVETILTTVEGTRNMLELCREKKARMIYLSSMEVYGKQPKGKKVTEDDVGAMLPTRLRSSYPLSKQLAECLCAGHAAEYGTDVKMIRLAQTFGPGVPLEDSRVFAMIARCAMAGQDVVLHTTGESAHSYLYTMDAVSAILKVLLEGQKGEAYTAANEDTYCSIAQMAQTVLEKLGRGESRVVFDIRKDVPYPDTSYLDLDTSKLRSLGWAPQYDLPEMYRNMMETMQ